MKPHFDWEWHGVPQEGYLQRCFTPNIRTPDVPQKFGTGKDIYLKPMPGGPRWKGYLRPDGSGWVMDFLYDAHWNWTKHYFTGPLDRRGVEDMIIRLNLRG